jgi:hypothetical protein
MDKDEKIYIDCFILYKLSGKIHSMITSINLIAIQLIYKNSEFDKKIEEIKETVKFIHTKQITNIITKFIITNDITEFKVENEYDACSILKNWWYFKNFNLFSNTHISYKVFNDWVMNHYKKTQKEVDEIVEKLQTINIDYVTFIY